MSMTRLDQFAEALSIHGMVHRAADEIGVSHSYGRVLFNRIKKRLGSQAI